MARPGLRQHPKFKRLLFMLMVPEPHALGYLELMWEAGYAMANAVLGSNLDVELAAGWPGEPGRLCAALVECRLLDEVEAGRYAIHDLDDHAPEYVKARLRMRRYRQRNRTNPPAAATKEPQELRNSDVTPQMLRNGYVTPNVAQRLRNDPLLPSSSPPLSPPTPPSNTSSSSPLAPPATEAQMLRNGDTTQSPQKPPKKAKPVPEGFDVFWLAYPRKVAKQDAVKAWTKLNPDAALKALILTALERQRASEQWRRDDGCFIPYPATWLNGHRWEDEDGATASALPDPDEATRREQRRLQREEAQRRERERDTSPLFAPPTSTEPNRTEPNGEEQ